LDFDKLHDHLPLQCGISKDFEGFGNNGWQITLIAKDLRSAGHDAIHIRDYNMQKATDLEGFARLIRKKT
jgi:hypothetical protein